MKEKLLQIINHYGVMPQLKYIHSEYFELDEVIVACEESGELSEYYQDNIAGEIVDVEMMLDQFKVYYGISQEKINEIKSYKANRQLKRIEEEKNGRNLVNN